MEVLVKKWALVTQFRNDSWNLPLVHVLHCAALALKLNLFATTWVYILQPFLNNPAESILLYDNLTWRENHGKSLALNRIIVYDSIECGGFSLYVRFSATPI